MTRWFRTRQLAFREGEILRVARDVLDEMGCRGLTMGKVAARLGISKGTLYRHFESREELLRRVVGDAWGRVEDEARRRAEAASPQERLTEVTGYLVRCFLGLGGDPPCCLQEVRCPFLDAARLEAPVPHLREVGGLGLGGAVRVLAGAIRASRRAEGRSPTEDDARGLLDLVLRGR